MSSLEAGRLCFPILSLYDFLSIQADVHEFEDMLEKKYIILLLLTALGRQATSMLLEPLLSNHCSMIFLDFRPPHHKLPHSHTTTLEFDCGTS